MSHHGGSPSSHGHRSHGNRSQGHRSTGHHSTAHYLTSQRSADHHRSTGNEQSGHQHSGRADSGHHSTSHHGAGHCYQTGHHGASNHSTSQHRSVHHDANQQASARTNPSPNTLIDLTRSPYVDARNQAHIWICCACRTINPQGESECRSTTSPPNAPLRCEHNYVHYAPSDFEEVEPPHPSGLMYRFNPHAQRDRHGRVRLETYDGGNTCPRCVLKTVRAGVYRREQLDTFGHEPVRGTYVGHGPDAWHPRHRWDFYPHGL